MQIFFKYGTFIRLKLDDVLERRIISTAVTLSVPLPLPLPLPDGIKPLERLATIHRPEVLRCKIFLEWEAKLWMKLREDIWLRPLEYEAQMFGTM
jgi:hypothetical protein